MSRIYPGPPPEAETINQVFIEQQWGAQPQYRLEVTKPSGTDLAEIAEHAGPYGEMLNLSCQRLEERLQQLRPMSPGYYFNHRALFIDHFISRPDTSIGDHEHVMLVGQEEHFDQVLPLILARRDDIAKLTGQEPPKFIVFLGDGETMEHEYRSIGSSPPPYSHAVLSALDCYINTDYIVPDKIVNEPGAIRAIWHEPAHVMWNLLAGEDFARNNMLAHEMLGGPLDIELWDDVKAPCQQLDFSQLARGEVAFWDWYKTTTALNDYEHLPYFENPVTRELILRVKAVGYATLYHLAKTHNHRRLLGTISLAV